MISSITDVILLAALAATSGAVLLMYRRLQRFDALQNAAAKEFARSSEALDRAREAISRLSSDGGEMAVTLAGRLNEARVIMNEIDEATTRTRGAYVELHEFETRHPPVPMPAPSAPEPAAAVAETPADLVEDEEDEVVEPRRTIPAAIRIRDAARARIAAAREKAAEAQASRSETARAPRSAVATPDDTARPVALPAAACLAAEATGRPAAAPVYGPPAPPPNIGAATSARPARGSATLAAQRPVPTGPIMMLVKNGDTRRGDDGSTSGTHETSAEFDAAMAAMNGRQFTWSDLASAAQRTA